MTYAFEEFELDPARFELRRAGTSVPLEPQVFGVLAYLVEHRDRVVTKSELFDHVWGNRFISEAALTSRLMAARKALGDSGQEQRYIKTVHGRGYRFVGDVKEEGGAAARTAVSATETAHRDAPAGMPVAAPDGGNSRNLQYVRTDDGATIGFWVEGKGYPLIHSTGAPFNHAQLELSLPDYAMWFRAYEERFLHVRFDARGSGLSSPDVTDFSLEAQCSDILAVADRLGIGEFALLATQASTLAAVRLAVTRPERVSHLVLVDGYANGREYLRLPQTTAFRALMEADWTLFTETLAHVLSGDWSATPSKGTASFFRECVSQKNCMAHCDAVRDADVTDLLDQVRQPTLVLHHKRIAYPAMENARVLAARIPDSRLVLLEGTWQEPGADIGVTMRAIETLLAVRSVRAGE